MTHKVLVAEDNLMDRRLLCKIVEQAGYEVVPAVDGDDAIKKFREVEPDLVILDVLMPGRDGFDVAREIKQSSGEAFIPIIFLTSITEAEQLALCVEAGGDDFLSKPYNRVILTAKLSAFQRMRDMHQVMLSQRDEITRHHVQLVTDQEAAKAVFDNVALSRQLEAPYIRQMLSPISIFNGDVLLASNTPANNLCVLLGDFTGHGLAAAIGAMPLADVFYTMTAKGFSLTEVVRECNRKLGSVLPTGYFCCATALLIDFSRCTVEYWNGGLPSSYLRRAPTGELQPLQSMHLPLGILSDEQFKSETVAVEAFPGDKLFLATDGVIEARSGDGEYFGAERLEQLLSKTAPAEMFDTIRNRVYRFMNDRDDDITMVEVTMISPEDIVVHSEPVQSGHSGLKDWKLSYELGPSSLRDFNPLPVLQQILMEAPYLRLRASDIYTVLSELYSNSLEHGVLGLSSELKNSADGFLEYYEARAAALNNVDGWIRFDIEGDIRDGWVHLVIELRDSGPGFDHAAYISSRARKGGFQNQYHGRGLKLLQDLCESVAYQGCGNEVQAIMSWPHDADAQPANQERKRVNE